jgi:hypothetical protein
MSDKGTDDDQRQKVGIGSFLWPLALVAMGAIRLSRPALSHKWDWAMIVIGGLFALLGLFAWRFGSPDRGARRVDELNQKLYAGVHERRAVDESTIRAYGLDLNFYGQTTEALERLGFRRLKDVVDVETEGTWLRCRAVIRTFLSGDGTAMCGVYHARFGGWVGLLSLIGVLPRKLKITDFETELTDGTFVTTSDAQSAVKTTEFPGISRIFLPLGTPTTALWAAHREHLQRELAGRESGVRAVVLRTYEELGASQDRLQLLKCGHRNSPAFDPAAEIALSSDKPLTAEEQALADEAARLHRERMAKR